MAGVTHIQMLANLRFDDGNVVTIHTPVWNKDIRNGDLFSEEEIRNIVEQCGMGLSELIGEKTINGIHATIKHNEYKNQMQGIIRKLYRHNSPPDGPESN